MKRPSRLMPKREQKTLGARVMFLILVLIGALAFICYEASPTAFWFTGLVILVIFVTSLRSLLKTKNGLIAIANSRTKESICNFARSFNTRVIDTWVVRATFDELQYELSFALPAFPVRASDDLFTDLQFDPEDLDLSLISNIAERAGRTLDKTCNNPYYGKVQTVKDLVLFINAQPLQRMHWASQY